MITLSAQGLHKAYGVESILEDISFNVNKKDKIGLIGRNGSGKTTLFKMVSGVLPPDRGELFIPKDLRLGYLEQAPDFDKNLTIEAFCKEVFRPLIEMEHTLRQLEKTIAAFKNHEDPAYEKTLEQYARLQETFESQNGYGYRSEIRGVLTGLGFSEPEFSKPVGTLSGGQKSRLGIARLLLSKPDILLLDEPTNHLDIKAINWLEAYLRSYESSVLLISHDRYFIDQVANRIFELENKRLLTHDGQYSDFMVYKRALRDTQLKEYREAEKEIKRQEEMVRRFKQRGTEKLAKRAASREKHLQKMVLPEKPDFLKEKSNIRFRPRIKSGRDVLFAEALSKSFSGKPVFENVRFEVYRNDKIGLIGPNGVGKTTLFKILLGKLEPDGGTLKIGHNVHAGYYDQELEGLHPDNDMVEEIAEASPHLTQTQIRTLLGGFLFYGDDVFKKISTLSGGEKSRLSLLKLMQSDANLLLLDEPTNHLDIPSKEALEEALRAYEGTLIAISHDRYFLNRVCDRIFDMAADGVDPYLGNYDDYLEKKLLMEELSKQEAAGPAKTRTQLKEERRREKEVQKRKQEKKKRLEALEADIAKAEEKKHLLEQDLCREEIYTDPDTMARLSQDYKALEASLKKMYQLWESLI